MTFFYQAIEKSSTMIKIACPGLLIGRCSLYWVQILPFTLEILASMVDTIYVSMVLHSYTLCPILYITSTVFTD